MNTAGRVLVVLDVIVSFLAAIFAIGFFSWAIVAGAKALYDEFKGVKKKANIHMAPSAIA